MTSMYHQEEEGETCVTKQEGGISKSNVPYIRKYLFASASSVPYPSLASSAFRHSDSRAQSEYFVATIVRSIPPVIVRRKDDNINKTDVEGYVGRGKDFSSLMHLRVWVNFWCRWIFNERITTGIVKNNCEGEVDAQEHHGYLLENFCNLCRGHRINFLPSVER
jgi:hypothetical protein